MRRFCMASFVPGAWLLLLGSVPSQSLSQDPRFSKPTIDDDTRFTNIGNIGLTITNFGTLGDGFVTQRPVDQPSCEYPLGSGIEHMFDGGLWIGAKRDNATLVTTGAMDIGSLRFDVAAGFEFTNSSDSSDVVQVRSDIRGSPFFHPEAISNQDFIGNFTDSNLVVPGTTLRIPQHTPLNVSVHLESYAWSFPFADAFVILNYTIKNTSQKRLRDVYVGLFADLPVRNVNITPARIGAPFYTHHASGYVDSLHMTYSYDYDGDPGFTDEGLYVALKLLGATPQVGDTTYQKRTIYNVWVFRSNPQSVGEELSTPQNDGERYERMRTPLLSPATVEFVRTQPGNYMTLLSTGPFQFLDPDSSINVVFAVVCASKYGNDPTTLDTENSKRNLYINARWAQRAYDGEDKNGNGVLDPGEDIDGDGKLRRFVLPTPPSAPRLKVIAGNQKATLYWDRSAEESRDLISGEKDFEGYRIYRTRLGEDLPGKHLLSSFTQIADFDSINGLGYDTGFGFVRLSQPITFDDEMEIDPATGQLRPVHFYYTFENENLLNGWQYAYAVTAYDRGDPKQNLPSLESSQLRNVTRVIPGTSPVSSEAGNGQERRVGVYPNPYRAGAAWDGKLERDRKMYFYNLPPRCEVRIYTLAGDMVDSFVHESTSYTGDDIQWFQKFSETPRVFSGGEHAWDLVTRDDQAIASGLYLYTVEDLKTGEIQRGKFLVIK